MKFRVMRRATRGRLWNTAAKGSRYDPLSKNISIPEAVGTKKVLGVLLVKSERFQPSVSLSRGLVTEFVSVPQRFLIWKSGIKSVTQPWSGDIGGVRMQQL